MNSRVAYRQVNIAVYKQFGDKDYWVAKAMHCAYLSHVLNPDKVLYDKWLAAYVPIELDACYDLATTPLVCLLEGSPSLVTQEQLTALLTEPTKEN